MSVFSSDERRAIIPRWRKFEVTRRSGELGPVGTPRSHQQVVSDFLETKLVDWERHRTVGHASDLVGSGVTLGRESEVAEAARFLLRDDLSATPWARELARLALDSPVSDGTDSEPGEVNKDVFEEQIRIFRHLVREEPNDPITWVELSRCYACIGLNEQAGRSMTVAHQLARDNRFVVRSASRLWTNLGDLDRAHKTIIATDRTRHDPWLLAAEIAVGTMAEKPPRLANVARQMISEGRHEAIHISELASAVATLQLGSGSTRKSKRLFNLSLEDPTENSIAQASWAARNYSAISFEEDLLKHSNAFEAESWNHYMNARWDHAVENCRLWLYDQPFSSLPCIQGSSWAAAALEDYKTSERFARQGLLANPSNFLLLNNLAFALTSNGQLGEARNVLSKAAKLDLSRQEEAVLQATKGLLEFRDCNIESGRAHYLKAQTIARELPDRENNRVFVLAHAFHAIEEISRANTNAKAISDKALQIMSRQRDPIIGVLEDRLKGRLANKLDHITTTSD